MGRQADRPDPKQAQAVDAIASGADVAKAADAAGVDRETLRDWLHHDAAFVAGLNRANRERADRLRAEVRALASEAVATLRELLTGAEIPPAVRLRAALMVLGSADAMKAEMIGPTTEAEVRAEMDHRDLMASLGV
jgi:hypothetical protein